MALDDVILRDLGSETGILKQTKKSIESGEDLSNGYDDIAMRLILKYADDEKKLDPRDQKELLKTITEEERDEIINDNLRPTYEVARDKLVAEVQPHYSEVLGKLDGNSLIQLILEAPVPEQKADGFEQERRAIKDHNDWETEFKNKNVDHYLGQSHKIVKEILEKRRKKTGNDDEILEYMDLRVQYHQGQVVEQFTDLEAYITAQRDKDDAGKSKAVHADKARDYLNAVVGDFKDEAEKQAYELAGIFYSSDLNRKEQDKKNEERSNALK